MTSEFWDRAKWQNLVAGITGGAVAVLTLHPLDLAKVRLQVNEGTGIVTYRPSTTGMFKTLMEIAGHRGYRGLYMGLTPNLIGAGGSWGFYFFFYENMKLYAQHNDQSKILSTVEYLGYAALSGALTLTIVNPIWVVKTRSCLQYEHLAQSINPTNLGTMITTNIKNTPVEYPKIKTWNTLVNLWKYEGLPGLYRGYLPGIIGVSHGAVQFMLYEQFRNLYNQKYFNRPVNTKLTVLEYLTFASTSKLLAGFITYPYQVVRARLQDQHRQYNGVMNVIRELWRGEGLYGFYKGLTPNLLRTVPSCGITFVVYEYTIIFLNKLFP